MAVVTGQRKLKRDVAHASIGEAARYGTQGLLLLLLARQLKPADLGVFVGAQALFLMLVPIVTFGAATFLIRSVTASDEPAGQSWARALTTSILGPVVFGLVALAVRPVVFPSLSPRLFALAALSDLVCSALIEIASAYATARNRFRDVPIIRGTYGGARLAALVIFASHAHLLSEWLPMYASASVVGALTAVGVSQRGLPQIGIQLPTRRDLTDGLTYSVGQLAMGIQDNVDKPMLVRAGHPVAAGLYGVAYRVVFLAMLPVRGLLQATFIRFFERGRQSVAEAAALARRMVAPAAAYSFLCGAMIFALAPWLSRSFGDGYGDASTMMRVLAFVPLLRSAQYFPGDALTGSGHHVVRLRVAMATSGLNIIANIALVRSMSWVGAAISTFIAESALAVALWVILIRVERAAAPMEVDLVSGDSRPTRTVT